MMPAQLQNEYLQCFFPQAWNHVTLIEMTLAMTEAPSHRSQLAIQHVANVPRPHCPPRKSSCSKPEGIRISDEGWSHRSTEVNAIKGTGGATDG